MDKEKLLVVVDESIASKRALEYVAKMIGGRQDIRVCLTHTLPSLPPELREISIVNDPKQESVRGAAFKAAQTQSILTEEREVQPILDWASDVLRKAGLPAEAIETAVCYPADGSAATGEILEIARKRACQTVVLGRESLSWLGELIHSDPAEELVRLGKGLTIWVVE